MGRANSRSGWECRSLGQTQKLHKRRGPAGPASGTEIEPALPLEISVITDGPLWLTGGIRVERSDGEPFEVRFSSWWFLHSGHPGRTARQCRPQFQGSRVPKSAEPSIRRLPDGRRCLCPERCYD